MMQNMRFDWRWVAVIIVIAIVASGSSLPWPIIAAALGGGGGYLLYVGWQIWSNGSIAPKRVTYWRGQRIETSPQRRSGPPPLREIGPALLPLLIGGALVLAAVALVLRQFEV